MSTEHPRRAWRIWLMPFLLALPFLAALIYGLIRFGPDLLMLFSVTVKALVVV